MELFPSALVMARLLISRKRGDQELPLQGTGRTLTMRSYRLCHRGLRAKKNGASFYFCTVPARFKKPKPLK
jgi:hypothetical protein